MKGNKNRNNEETIEGHRCGELLTQIVNSNCEITDVDFAHGNRWVRVDLPFSFYELPLILGKGNLFPMTVADKL